MNALEIANQVANSGLLEGAVATVVGSGLLTPVTRRLKNQSDLFKMVLVYTVFALGAGVNYLLSTPTNNPKVIGFQAAAMFVAAQPLYFKAFKPLAAAFGAQLAKAAAWDEQMRAAKAQVEAPTPQPADFSN